MGKFWTSTGIFLLTTLGIESALQATELYRKPENAVSRWSTFENLNGVKGRGGMENRCAKGRAFVRVEAGESKVLASLCLFAARPCVDGCIVDVCRRRRQQAEAYGTGGGRGNNCWQ